MNREEQVRRFVDGELSASERGALLRAAERDLALASELLRAQELRAEMTWLREVTTPSSSSSAQVQRIMQRASAARQAHEASPWRLLRALWLPRFRVSAGGLLVSSLAVAMVALGVATFGPLRQAPRVDPVPSDGAVAVGAPRLDAVSTQVPVRFVLPAAGAKSVSLVGDFNAWKAEATRLDDSDGDGVFATTLLLPRGSYGYMFVVDGERWTADPYATNFRDDGFGQRNAVIRVN